MIQNLSLRQIKSRIRSVENTKKITRAMEMVSSAKLKRMRQVLASFEVYSRNLEELFGRIFAARPGIKHPFFPVETVFAREAVCLIASDTGLCGSYNHIMLQHIDDLVSAQKTGESLAFFVVGKKAFMHCREKGYLIEKYYTGYTGRYQDNLRDALAADMTQWYRQNYASRCRVAYMRYDRGNHFVPYVVQILPLKSQVLPAEEFIFEPVPEIIMDKLLLRVLAARLKINLLESFISEHQARALAMGEATQNAVELLEGLILTRNKVRQGNITKEILEVVSSVEALRG